MDGARLDGIAFRAADTLLGSLLLNSRGASLHVAGRSARTTIKAPDASSCAFVDVAPAR